MVIYSHHSPTHDRKMDGDHSKVMKTLAEHMIQGSRVMAINATMMHNISLQENWLVETHF
jgi:hypothetical protein